MDTDRSDALAALIDAAHLGGELLDPIPPAEQPDLAGAYAVQRRLTARRVRRGARRVGWKLGYTSAAMREQMGVDSPNFGPLLDSMLIGDRLPAGLAQPRVEPEIAVRVDGDGRPVEVRAALEVVDSVWRDYRFTLEMNTADGSSAAGVVVGDVVTADDLAGLEVELLRNGELRARGVAAAAMGHPFTALAWLAAELPTRGEVLRAGDLVITGGLTAAVPLRPGDEIEARFGDVSVRVTRPADDHRAAASAAT